MPDNRKGIILLVVLATVMVAIILANIILSTMSNQSRLTHHQVSRIQAYYASLAGMNLAYDHLRAGDDLATWPMPATQAPNLFYTRFLCQDAAINANCGGPNAIIDVNLPVSLVEVAITVTDRNAPAPPRPCNAPAGSQLCIDATATYTYTP